MGVYALIMEISSSCTSVINYPELRKLAIRPSSLYFQENRKISQRVLNRRNRQLSIVTVVLAQMIGIGTIISTRHFHTQRYRFVKHPKSFFKLRPKMHKDLSKTHGELNLDKDYEDIILEDNY